MDAFITSVSMSILLFSPLAFAFFLKKQKMLNDRIMCILIILMGLILRLIYLSYTTNFDRQHDVYYFFYDDDGHAGYIVYLFENHRLPDFDPTTVWQFYHPPLHHIICAVWMTLLELIGIPAKYDGSNTLQYLTLIYSVLFCVFAYKTFVRLKIKSTALCISTALVTFHPTLIILAGSLNNDMLSSLFAMMAIYFTVRWSQDRKWLDIIMIAFSVGLGMFTKLSVGLLAPAIAAVFLMVFIKNIKEFKKLIPQFLVFAVICCPIGLFWSIRCYVKFGMPLNYVPKLSDSSGQYIDKSVFERLTNWSLYQFSSPFTQWLDTGKPYNEFNPFIALLKSAMFDEETFFNDSITLQSFCTALFFVNFIVVIFSLVAMIVTLLKNKSVKTEIKVLLGVLFAVIFGNYIIFCINYPHVCTQNMRYCVPLIFVGAAFIGMFINGAEESKSEIYKKSAVFIKKSSVIFCILAAFVYTFRMFSPY